MAQRKKERPGVLIYFELIPALERLTNEQRGRLLYGAIIFAHDGMEPKIDDDPILPVIWPLLASRIKSDGKRYSEQCEENALRRRFGCYRSAREKAGKSLLTYEEWKEQVSSGNFESGEE